MLTAFLPASLEAYTTEPISGRLGLVIRMLDVFIRSLCKLTDLPILRLRSLPTCCCYCSVCFVSCSTIPFLYFLYIIVPERTYMIAKHQLNSFYGATAADGNKKAFWGERVL